MQQQQHSDWFSQIEEMTREELMKRLRAFRGKLPKDFKFDRDDANARQDTPQMPDKISNRSQSGKPDNNDGEQTLSPHAILVILVVIALVCVGGYFLLMKLIDVSRQEDCMLAGRRNCAPIEVPSRR